VSGAGGSCNDLFGGVATIPREAGTPGRMSSSLRPLGVGCRPAMQQELMQAEEDESHR
jgi:hypothetical protein